MEGPGRVDVRGEGRVAAALGAIPLSSLLHRSVVEVNIDGDSYRMRSHH